MIIQAVTDAQEILTLIGEDNRREIEPGLFAKIQVDPNEQPDLNRLLKASTVKLPAVKKSIRLTEYYLTHKKFLAGYKKDEEVKSNTEVNKDLARKILLREGETVTVQVIARSSRYTADCIKKEMQKLQIIDQY